MAGDLNFTVDFQTQQAANQIVDLFNKFKSGSQEAGRQLNTLLGGTVEKKVQIRFEKNDAGIKEIATKVVEIRSELDKLDKAYTKLNKIQPGSLTNLKQSLAEAVQARNAIAQFGQTIDLVNKKQLLTTSQTQAFTEADAKVKQLQKSLNNLRIANLSGFEKLSANLGLDKFLDIGGKLQNIVLIFQSVGIAISALTAPIREATNALSELQSFSLSFQAISQGAAGATTALNESSRIALGLGVNILGVRDAFRQLSPVILASKDAAGNTKNTLSDVSSVVEALSSRFAVFGLTADKSQRVFNGIVQAFGKGRLAAEELTQQIGEADPAFKTDFAAAAYAARDSLGDLGIQIDGTVKNLDELVASGQITSDVLLKVIPGISKSSQLFGKLGSSALSAVSALEKGDVIISQVKNQLANLSQLSLERLANSAQPLVVALFKIQATFADFATSISKLEGTKSVLQILGRIGQAVQRLLEIILSAAEGFLVIISPILQFANALAGIPGVIELIGAALLSGFIGKFKQVKAVTGNLTEQFIQDFKEIRQAAVITAKGTNKSLDAISKERKKDAIAPSITVKDSDVKIKKAGNPPEVEVKLTANGAALRKEILNNIKGTKEYQDLLEKAAPIQAKLEANEARRAENAEKIAELERKRTAYQGQIDNPKVQGKERIKTKVDLSDVKKELARLNSSQRGLTVVANQYQQSLQSINQQLDGAVVRADRLAIKMEEAARAAAINERKMVPDTGGTGKYARELSDTTKVNNIAKQYYQYLIKGEQDVATGKDKNIQKLNKLINQLEQRRKLYLDIATAQQKQAGGDITPEVEKSRTKYEALTTSLNKATRTRDILINGIKDEVTARFNLGDTISTEGSRLDQLNAKYQKSINVLDAQKQAYSNLAQSTRTLLADQRILQSLLAKEKVKLGKAQGKQPIGAPDTAEITASKNAIQAYSDALETNGQRIRTNQQALKNLGPTLQSSQLQVDELKAAVDESNSTFGKARQSFNNFRQSTLKGIELNFGGKNTNLYKGVESAFNRIGIAFDNVGEKIKGAKANLKNFTGGLKALGAEFGFQIALTVASIIATKAFNEATSRTRQIAEDSANAIKEITAARDDLSKALEKNAAVAGDDNTVLGIDPNVKKQYDGAKLALLAIGDGLVGIRDVGASAFSAGFKAVENSLNGSMGPLESFGSAVAGTAANMGTFAAAGAAAGFAIGATITAITGPGAIAFGSLGATIGAVIGTIAGLVVTFQSADRQIKENTKAANAYIKGVQEQSSAVTGFIAKLKESVKAQKDAQAEAARLRQQNAPQSQVAMQENKSVELEASTIAGFAAAGKAIDKTRTELENYRAAAASTKQVQNQLFKEINKWIELPDTTPKREQTLQSLRAQLKLVGSNYGNLQNIIIQLNAALKVQEVAIEEASAGLDENTSAAINSKKSIANLGEQLNVLEQALASIDQNIAPDTFARLAQQAGGLKAEIDLLNNSANSQKLIGYINQISSAFRSGAAIQSVANLKLALEALNSYVVTLKIDSRQFNEAIGRIGQVVDANEQANRLIQSANKTTAQLKIDILRAENTLASANHERRMRELDKETRAVQTKYDAQIAALQAQTPAEQRLAELRRQQLERQARYGATEEERLQATAQLERDVNNKRIATLQQQRDEELKKIEETKRAELERLRATEDALKNLENSEVFKGWQADMTALAARQQAFNEKLTGTVDKMKDAKTKTGDLVKKIDDANPKMETLRSATKEVADYMGVAALGANAYADNLERAVTAYQKLPKNAAAGPGAGAVLGFRGAWTGGPVTGGQTYTVNELGTEGFMSKSGKITTINKPRWGTWTAPSSGTVIPAHIFKELRMRKHALSSPKTGIDHRTPVINKRLANLSSEVNVSAKVETVQTQDYGYNAQYQALQAKQLGKLASAINELNEKNWNIQVNVRNTGSTAYFDSLNRIM